jgi:thiamine biosynthesis lipoprotein ApbE
MAFGAPLEIEVRDLPRDAADAALRAAIAEAAEVERLTDAERPDGGISQVNATAGLAGREVDPRLFEALVRASNFCWWSGGKEGPLGRDLNRLWGRGAATPPAAAPGPDALGRACAAAACRNLSLDPARKMVTLAAGSALDLADFRAGMAADRVIAVLRQHGSADAFVQAGPVRRGIGAGIDGHGWPVGIPALGGLVQPLGIIYLRDQALAIDASDGALLHVGGQIVSPYINQLTGQPVEGVAATLAATDLAIDAQALAATMAITGTQEGEILMGSIRPRPSILWLMGTGSGIPLLVDYRWTELGKR